MRKCQADTLNGLKGLKKPFGLFTDVEVIVRIIEEKRQ